MTAQQLTIIPFQFEANSVRTIVDDHGNPWFVLKDVMAGMNSSSTTTQAIQSINQILGEGFVNNIPLQTAGGTQDTIIIAEAAATFLISRSNTEQGRRMSRWIHVDVLPEIRKKGVYSRELSREEILVMALESERERVRLAKELDAAKPMIEFHEEVSQSETEYTVPKAAKILFNGSVKATELREWLKNNGWMDRRKGFNEPTMWAIRQEYMRLRLRQKVSKGIIADVPMITSKGFVLLRHLYRTGDLFLSSMDQVRCLPQPEYCV